MSELVSRRHNVWVENLRELVVGFNDLVKEVLRYGLR